MSFHKFMSSRQILVTVLCYIAAVSADGPSMFSTVDTFCDGSADPELCLIDVCPDCTFVDCIPELRREDCPEGSVLTRGLVGGGCCPACVTYIKMSKIHLPNLPLP